MEMKTVCLTADTYDAIPEITAEEHLSGKASLPYRYECGTGQMLVKGYEGIMEMRLVRRVSEDPEQRVKDLAAAGLKCQSCQTATLEHEVMIEQEDGKKAAVYFCGKCFRIAKRRYAKTAKGNRKAKNAANHSDRKPIPFHRGDVKARRKKDRNNRKKSRSK